MGTNYYVVKNFCKHCGRGDREFIGRSSAGWKFKFKGTDEIRDFNSWLANVKSGDFIENSYGARVDLDDLLDLIESKHGDKSSIAAVIEAGDRYTRMEKDERGNEFCFNDFS